jgi:hypothetical protein
MPIMPADNVHTREDFVRFVRSLSRDTQGGLVENDTLPRYLEAVAAWTNDCPGYFANEQRPLPEAGWSLFAVILQAALIYE